LASLPTGFYLSMKVALVHDWLTGMRGGERCLEVFCELFPDADLYTLLHLPGTVSPKIESMRIRTSFLQNLPGIKKYYRYYLPLMPWAIGSFNLSGYDLILSSSHCVAKGICYSGKSKHICYCFTPMRYVWDQFEVYFSGKGRRLQGFFMSLLQPFLKYWDTRSNRNVHQFIAISRHVQKKIESYYQRESTVIVPPVNTDFYTPTDAPREDYFLIVSALSPYKRVDLAVEAFNELGYPLRIIGVGPEMPYLRSIAASNIQFLGWATDEQVRSHYARCRALVFPGEEDFGIVPLEAQAMGCPVIAFGKGGALETIIPEASSWKPQTGIPNDKTQKPTGLFFYQVETGNLCKAIEDFIDVETRFDAKEIRTHALQFSLDQFQYRVRMFLREYLKKSDAEKI
jgi:glycosyltransferase involved in cell wall biosynthesis